jgi:hypothetical protein
LNTAVVVVVMMHVRWDPWHPTRLRCLCRRIVIVEDYLSVDGAIIVLAVTALAIVAAEDPCLETLAILLEAPGLLAGTSL